MAQMQSFDGTWAGLSALVERVSPGSVLRRVEKYGSGIDEGIGWDTHIQNEKGESVVTLNTREVAFMKSDKDQDLVEKAEELVKKLGIDIKIVDIEIEFNGSTEIFVSFLWWRWSIFEDSPLPYLN